MPMDITLLVPGMPFDGNTLISEQSLGGSETMGALVARELVIRGHRVRVYTSLRAPAAVHDGVLYSWMGEPSERLPFGHLFHQWAENIPQDVLIIQRIPGAFGFRFASKVNLGWTHDLAVRRSHGPVLGQMWNTDRIMAVSRWHKDQIASVYGIAPGSIVVLRNGVVPSRFGEPLGASEKRATKRVLYSSRPERGPGLFLVNAGGTLANCSPVCLQ